jgi:CheY-like chemotaxis protein
LKPGKAWFANVWGLFPALSGTSVADVTVKTDSIEALELFQSQPDRVDLVITDMTLPKMTGLQLIRELKKIRPDIPIILCTGFSARIDENGALAENVQAFVLKPFLKVDLAKVIRGVLENR